MELQNKSNQKIKIIKPKKVHLRQTWTLVFDGRQNFKKKEQKKKPLLFKRNMIEMLKNRHSRWYSKIEGMKRNSIRH